jgi:hypothetical protein
MKVRKDSGGSITETRKDEISIVLGKIREKLLKMWKGIILDKKSLQYITILII